MLEQATGLSLRALEAIAGLEREVVAADGGRLKLGWGTLRGRSGERAEDVLWWEDDRLLGFVGLYDFGPRLEVAGMVAPSARRRGIGTALLESALALARAQGHRRALLIVPRGSEDGRRLALRHGGVLDHSEHALVLGGEPLAATSTRRADVSLRAATPGDTAQIARLLAIAFGLPMDDDEPAPPGPDTQVIEADGVPVGTIRLSRDEHGAGVYGFVIGPERQGQGIGREALLQACERLRAEGEARIRLEVAVDNDRALTLYTSLGFMPQATEDYYALSL